MTVAMTTTSLAVPLWGFAGVLVGSVTTAIVQFKVAKQRVDFEEDRGRRDRLQVAYAGLLAAAHRAAISTIIKPADNAEVALIDEVGAINLLAPSDTYEAARAFGYSAIKQRYVIAKKDVPEHYKNAQPLIEAREAFLSLAKRDLRIVD